MQDKSINVMVACGGTSNYVTVRREIERETLFSSSSHHPVKCLENVCNLPKWCLSSAHASLLMA